MTRIDLDEAGLDPEECCFCDNDTTFTDRYGLPWCDDHKHRGTLLNKGVQHQWPDLQCSPFAIGADEDCWYMAATSGMDDLIWFALAAIEYAETF